MKQRHPELEALVRKINDVPVSKLPGLIDEAFDLATRLLQEKMKAQLPKFFEQIWDDGGAVTHNKVQPLALTPPTARRTIPGSYTEIVRGALATFVTASDGVDADKLLAKIRHDNPVSDVTVKRVRGVLKTLAKSGQASRIGRGRYKPLLPDHVGDGTHTQH